MEKARDEERESGSMESDDAGEEIFDSGRVGSEEMPDGWRAESRSGVTRERERRVIGGIVQIFFPRSEREREILLYDLAELGERERKRSDRSYWRAESEREREQKRETRAERERGRERERAIKMMRARESRDNERTERESEGMESEKSERRSNVRERARERGERERVRKTERAGKAVRGELSQNRAGVRDGERERVRSIESRDEKREREATERERIELDDDEIDFLGLFTERVMERED
ncbi:hypothetical protein Tco_0381502 [Tanacetum coccineum]